MGAYAGSRARGRPLVEQVAGYIADPVLRLRFIKTAARVAHPQGRWARWLWRLTPWGVALLCAVLAAAVSLAVFARQRSPEQPAGPPTSVHAAAPAAAPPASQVWLVEQNGEFETYSNGLRVDTRYLTRTHPRSYLVFPAAGGPPTHRDQPAGIVFHTTESPQAPFEAAENGVLRRIGESLLEYVRRRQAYHFLIDRFGRVYRIVAQGDAANHCGHSVWADAPWRYVNLNESFLGIAFEGVTPAAGEEPGITGAQERAAATLVEWLRSRYRIPPENCLTHAQVSVNPYNMRVGLHVDWASGFPFAALGLPDNYSQALPSLWAFGFETDSAFTRHAGAAMRAGIEAGEAKLARDAVSAGMSVVAWRKLRRGRFHQLLAAVQRARGDSARAE